MTTEIAIPEPTCFQCGATKTNVINGYQQWLHNSNGNKICFNCYRRNKRCENKPVMSRVCSVCGSEHSRMNKKTGKEFWRYDKHGNRHCMKCFERKYYYDNCEHRKETQKEYYYNKRIDDGQPPPKTQTCVGLCINYKAKKPSSGPRYAAGQKMCSTCDIFINYDGLVCPCCGIKLRTKQIKSVYKEKTVWRAD